MEARSYDPQARPGWGSLNFGSTMSSNARPVVKLAFEFLLLTATRSGEVRGALWTEIDQDEGAWIIPALRTKAAREHRVPLCRRALEILEEALERGHTWTAEALSCFRACAESQSASRQWRTCSGR